MHEDLKAIIALWDNLHSADDLRKEAKARVERKRHCGEIPIVLNPMPPP